MRLVNNDQFSLSKLPPLSLYVHIPWCIKKCPYCDFNSHTLNTDLPENEYVQSLTADLEQALPLIWGRSIRTIFIGGGTPSLFSGDSINQIITQIRNLTNLSPFAEITIEANPGAIDKKHIMDYKLAGVNRISFGIQSFNNKHLQSLGRIHDRDQAINAINIAKKHFEQINLDLIYALPDQTVGEVLSDLQIAIDFNTTHLSCYNLTIEPNTKFHQNPPQNLPDNDLCYTMQDLIVKTLYSNGYSRYEISAYAKNSNFCDHNLNYWQFGDYLGIGAGAHSKISFYDRIIRQVRQKHPQTYMDIVDKNKHMIENKIVGNNELPFEFMLNALRLSGGFATNFFVERTGLPLTSILKQLNQATDLGFINFTGNKIVPTNHGQDFLNELLMLFLE